MQCIINELKEKSCLVTAEVMKLGFPHTPPQYFQLSLIFPTHHMLCTLSSPPWTSLFMSWTGVSICLLCCRVKVVLLSWMDAAFQMPGEARVLYISHTGPLRKWLQQLLQAPGSSAIITQCFWDLCKAGLNRPLKLLRSTTNRWKVGLHKSCLRKQT